MGVTLFDRILIGAELAVGVLVGLCFLVPYLLRRSWRQSPWGWHMVAVAAVMTGEAAAFLLMLLGLHVQIWVFEIGFGLVDVVGVQRLWLLLRTPQPSPPTDG